MKYLLPLAILSTTLASHAAEIRLADCPPEAQKTIQQNSRGGRIDDIESYSIQGKMLYVADVEFAGNRDLKIHVAADGALVKTREDITLADAPEAVRKAIESKLSGGKAYDMEKETGGDTVTYYVEINRKGSPDLDLTISSDGKVLSEIEDVD